MPAIAVCANGAVLLDLADEHVLARHAIGPAAPGRWPSGCGSGSGSACGSRSSWSRSHRWYRGPPVRRWLGERLRPRIRVPPPLPVPDVSPRMPLAELLALPDPVKLLARLDSRGERRRGVPGDGAVAGRGPARGHALQQPHPAGVRTAGITKATALSDLVAGYGLTRSTWWPLGTCRTTWRCCTGRASGWRCSTGTTRRSPQPIIWCRARWRTVSAWSCERCCMTPERRTNIAQLS